MLPRIRASTIGVEKPAPQAVALPRPAAWAGIQRPRTRQSQPSCALWARSAALSGLANALRWWAE